MAKFLRDEFLKNITITEEILKLINDFLTERETSNNEILAAPGSDDQGLLLTYVIRFDNRGYTLVKFLDVLKYYTQAADVERVVFLLDSNLSEKTNNKQGDRFEFRLDSKNPNNSIISVSSDDRETVDTIFNGLMEIIAKCQNRNDLVRSTWSLLLVQVLGVAAGFVISLIAGIKIAPYLKIENAFILSFLFTFLIFSNAWGFIHQQIIRFLEYSFPNVRFSRKDKKGFHWLAQALVAGVILAISLFLINYTFDWVGRIFGQYISK